MDETLPEAFDAGKEKNAYLARAKKRLAKAFRWTKESSLYCAAELAFLLHVFGKDDETLEICRALGRIEFAGTFHRWSAVELALTLQARLTRASAPREAKDCVRRIREAGFVEDRLTGCLLDPNDSLKESLESGDTKQELDARVRLGQELAFMIELGGSKKCPVPKLEHDYQENLARLRTLTAAPPPAKSGRAKRKISTEKPS